MISPELHIKFGLYYLCHAVTCTTLSPVPRCQSLNMAGVCQESVRGGGRSSRYLLAYTHEHQHHVALHVSLVLADFSARPYASIGIQARCTFLCRLQQERQDLHCVRALPKHSESQEH